MATKKSTTKTKKAAAKKKTTSKKTVKKKVASKKSAVKKTAKKAVKKNVQKKVAVKNTVKKATTKKISISISKRDLNTLKSQLLDKRSELVRTLSEELNSANISEQQFADILDQSNFSYDSDLFLQHTEQEAQELMQVNKALEQLENGVYGLCETCEEFIGVPRLKALPFATLCIKCKSEQEQDNYNYSGPTSSTSYRKTDFVSIDDSDDDDDDDDGRSKVEYNSSDYDDD